MDSNQFEWRFNQLDSNELHCIVPKLSFYFQYFEYAIVYNFTNIQAMSHTSYFFIIIARQSIFQNLSFT